MVRNKTFFRVLLSIALITGVIAVLPAAAQEADWLVTSERGTVGISSPTAGETVSGEVEIMGTATSPAFSYYKVEYSVDGSAWVTVDEDWQHEAAVTNDALASWDVTGIKNGAYWLRAVVVDNTGNFVASDPIQVMVSNPVVEAEVAAEPEAEEAAEAVAEAVAEEAAPAPAAAPSWLVTSERGTVGISSPAAGETVSGEVEIMGTATSPAFSYYKVEYSVDGSAWVTVDEDWQHEAAVTNDALASWDVTGIKNGAYWLRAVVVDNTGNYVASDPIKVTVDNPPLED